MMMRTGRNIAALAGAVLLAAVFGQVRPVFAEGITKVRGTVVDAKGKPMARVPIYFEGVDINKRVGPVKTKKNGKYFISTLDKSIVKKWRVVPELRGYKVVKAVIELVDSRGVEVDKREHLLGSKQEFPVLQFPLVGDSGRNVVDLVLAKDSEFAAADRAEREKRKLAAAEGAEAAAEAAPAAAGAEEVPVAPQVDTVAMAKSLETAKQLTDAGRHEEAIELYNAFLTKDPRGNPAAYYYLGKSLFELGNDRSAEQGFLKGLELKPDMKGAHFFLGNIAMRDQNPDRAVAEYEKEIELSPDSDVVYFNLGKARMDLGQDAEALAALEQAALLNPGKSETYMMMASVYEKRKETSKAEEMYQKVIAIDPKNAAISFYNIGVHAWNENRGADAVQAFRKALEIDPAYPPTHRELARALMGSGEFPGALKHFEEYLRLNPGAPDAREIRESIALLRN